MDRRCLTDLVRLVLQSFALLVLAVPPLSAQDRPNFSGEWVRVEPPGDQTAVLNVVQDSYSIRIDHKSADGPRSSAYGLGTEGGIVGGLIGGTTAGPTNSILWSATWKDVSLVITRAESTTQAGVTKLESSREEVWGIDRDGLLVIVITHQETGAAETTRFVYRRNR